MDIVWAMTVMATDAAMVVAVVALVGLVGRIWERRRPADLPPSAPDREADAR
jgi:hypothetical protein